MDGLCAHAPRRMASCLLACVSCCVDEWEFVCLSFGLVGGRARVMLGRWMEVCVPVIGPVVGC